VPTWILIRKDLRLSLRDRRALIVLLLMPLLLIFVLALSLGEGYERLRITIVDLDRGYIERDPDTKREIPHHWSKVVEDDLAQTAGIRVEYLDTEEEAREMVSRSQRAAVLVFGPKFSEQVTHCSFLANGVNPYFRDGVNLEVLDAKLITDPTQITAASIIEQVAQVTTLRVVMPWMIGRAFDMIGKQLGSFVKGGLQEMFPSYDLTATSWAGLTRSRPRSNGQTQAAVPASPTATNTGLLNRGAARYQVLVPSYLVMFAYFLVLVVGRLFVSELRQGTMKRLRAAPLSRWQILVGKFVPAYLLSIVQGIFLLVAGRIVFGMNWGPQPLWLVLVVLTTSLSAMGLALVVAALARTESQVAVYGTLLVLALAGLSGCLMGDRELMPEIMRRVSLITPHAWALDAYRQLLANPAGPNLTIVLQSCAMLAAFGIALVLLGWSLLRLEDTGK
jgi:ABC-type multidrug transport system permease subunit